jgi:hypothetical protein
MNILELFKKIIQQEHRVPVQKISVKHFSIFKDIYHE